MSSILPCPQCSSRERLPVLAPDGKLYTWQCQQCEYMSGDVLPLVLVDNGLPVPAGSRECQQCGRLFTGRRDAKYCGALCRKAAQRDRDRHAERLLSDRAAVIDHAHMVRRAAADLERAVEHWHSQPDRHDMRVDDYVFAAVSDLLALLPGGAAEYRATWSDVDRNYKFQRGAQPRPTDDSE